MNIEIEFRKTILENNPEVTVRFGDVIRTFELVAEKQIERLTNLEHDKDTQLIVGRNQKDILESNLTHHSNNICVDKVIVDDFWQFDANFHTPTSILDDDYEKHLDRLGEGAWIKDSLKHNTHLFFNGKLLWDIKYPVRRTFLKDVNR